MLFIYQHSSCAICWTSLWHLLHQLPGSFTCLGNAAARWTAEMRFLRAPHDSASFLNVLCWHILKTDTHTSKEANKSSMWQLHLFFASKGTKPWNEAMIRLSLLILWRFWWGFPLCSQVPLCISQCWSLTSVLPMRLSTAWSLFLWDCQDWGLFSAFSLFFLLQASQPFWLYNSTYNPLKIPIYFILLLLWWLTKEERTFPTPYGKGSEHHTALVTVYDVTVASRKEEINRSIKENTCLSWCYLVLP